MPEGPEIRRAADKVQRAIAGNIVESVELFHPNLEDQEVLFLNHEVLSIGTRGKAMLTRFSSGWTIYSHNQLYGRWTVNLITTPPRSNRSLRLSITAGRHTARLWSATDIDVLPTEAEQEHPFIANLGPDVLDPESTPELISERLISDSCRNRKAATLMLDQRAFAGLGNYLRSEILFISGVHPDDRPRDLDPSVIEKWGQAIRQLSGRAYQTGGITVDEVSASRGKASGRPRRQWRHYVFNREGQGCPHCSETIIRKRYGGRRLDFCPSCQPAKRLSLS